MRIAICGGPRTGKTTLGQRLADQYNVPLVSTDDWIGFPWEEIPDQVLRVLETEPEFVLEGVNAARVLRRWLRVDPNGPELDRVYWLTQQWVPLSDGQLTMTKGVATVFGEVRPGLRHHGIPVLTDAGEN